MNAPEPCFVKVDIIEARNLPKMDLIGSCDGYCKVWLSTRATFVRETKVVKNSKNPSWNESFSFTFDKSSLDFISLNIDVYDWDRVGGHDLVSRLSIPLATLEDTGVDGKWFDLPRQKTKSGEQPPQIKLRITVKIHSLIPSLEA